MGEVEGSNKEIESSTESTTNANLQNLPASKSKKLLTFNLEDIEDQTSFLKSVDTLESKSNDLMKSFELSGYTYTILWSSSHLRNLELVANKIGKKHFFINIGSTKITDPLKVTCKSG